eukprot:TRINITY_DN11679_c0_g1_i2.p1 TRINITY_DN11679_c0_g1~~TRINITY_DN11679_c0_g1_i2.p1  ORF type:complete len:865 (+),score=85.20 TRINITY_DN11679_c0_g1_i2:91-2685(+)
MSAAVMRTPTPTEPDPHDGSPLDIVQFSCPVYYVKEQDKFLQIEVMRLGSIKGQVSVRYYTEDVCAKAGSEYEGSAAELTMLDGQWEAAIKIPILDNGYWTPTLEFRVFLVEPRGCTLGLYLHTARVKIFTDDIFPHDRFQTMVEDLKCKDSYQIPRSARLSLFWEFFQLYYLHRPGMKFRTNMCLLFDQLLNIQRILVLLANLFLVNVVLKDNADTESELYGLDRQTAAWLVGLIYIVPMFFVHFWDVIRIRLDMVGYVEWYMQADLFKKYLNYSERSRGIVKPAQMHVATMQLAGQVAGAYANVVELIRLLLRILFLCGFMCFSQPRSLAIIPTFPLVLGLFAILRADALDDAEHGNDASTKIFISLLNEVCDKYHLVASYSQRPQMSDRLQETAEDVRLSRTSPELVKTNNGYCPKWLGPVLAGSYIVACAPMVLRESLTLGVFLAVLSVLGDLSSLFGDIFNHIMRMNEQIGALLELLLYLNMETDLPQFRKVLKVQRATTVAARKHVLQMEAPHKSEGLLRSDLVELQMQGVSFSYTVGQPIFSNISVACAQGKLVAVVGSHNSGKTTFMKLFAQQLFPTQGNVFVPTYLRTLLVSREPVLLSSSLWDNLTFGTRSSSPQLVRDILRELELDALLEADASMLNANVHNMPNGVKGSGSEGNQAGNGLAFAGRNATNGLASGSKLSRSQSRGIAVPEASGGYQELRQDEDLGSLSDPSDGESSQDEMQCAQCPCYAEHIHVNEPDMTWAEALSYTIVVKINLARAFILNSEVLVLHRPFHHYDDHTSRRVMRVIRKHMQNRGLGLSPETAHGRRPRTIIFTPETVEELDADLFWQLDPHLKTVYAVAQSEVMPGFVPPER